METKKPAPAYFFLTGPPLHGGITTEQARSDNTLWPVIKDLQVKEPALCSLPDPA